jgi:UDP-N-acetylmuramate--alanine ligase
MAGLAQLLVQGGVVVTASEQAPSRALASLSQLGVRIQLHGGHAARPCPRSAQWLIGSRGLGRTQSERLSALRRDLPVSTPIQCLEALLHRGTGLAVIGGRSARVATAMIGWVLTQAGRDPTVVLGTHSPQLGGWARLGAGPHVIVEAILDEGLNRDEEVDDAWSQLAPRLAVLLDDRSDPSTPARVATLRALAGSIPDDGTILARAGDATVEAVVQAHGLKSQVEWLALTPSRDWWGADLRQERGRYRFRVFHGEHFVTEIGLQVPGLWNVLAALAAVAASARLDVPVREIREALEDFMGVSGDFESRGSYRGVTLIDDEGSDAAAVGEALQLARCVFGGRKIWSVLIAPAAAVLARASDRYAAALAPADEVLLSEDRESCPEVTRALATALSAVGVRVRSVAGLDAAFLELDRHLEPGDVLVTLGAGDVGTISDAFIRRLPRDRPGR